MAALLEVAQEVGAFTTLLRAVEQAGLAGTLQPGERLTLFAPTDDAFAALDEEVLQSHLPDEARLAKVLRYHLVAGDFSAAELAGVATLTTLEGDDLRIDGTTGCASTRRRWSRPTCSPITTCSTGSIG